MGYLHISNLYKDQRILEFKRVYALEKVHGTSAHIRWVAQDIHNEPDLTFFSGGEKHEKFVALFDQEVLKAQFVKLGLPDVTVFGEAYGGKQQGMRETYGDALRFIVFDVQVGDTWLAVPDMVEVAEGLGLEVVPWTEVGTDPAVLNAIRDYPSEVAMKRGCGQKAREGVVLRPKFECRTNNGERVIAKHKNEKFEERKTAQKITDPAKLEVLSAAAAIAQEWVTEMRLTHVLDKLPGAGIEDTPKVLDAMVEDVYREAKGEIVESKEAQRAIRTRAGQLFRSRLKGALQ